MFVTIQEEMEKQKSNWSKEEEYTLIEEIESTGDTSKHE